MNIHRVGTCLIPLESWEGAEHRPVDGIRIGHLVVEGSGVESVSARIDTGLITKAKSMDIDRAGTYLIPLDSWEGAGHCACDGIRIDTRLGQNRALNAGIARNSLGSPGTSYFNTRV